MLHLSLPLKNTIKNNPCIKTLFSALSTSVFKLLVQKYIFSQEKVTGELSGPKLVNERGEREGDWGWKSPQPSVHTAECNCISSTCHTQEHCWLQKFVKLKIAKQEKNP